ncbi:hypothetical protein GCM10009679_46790 [Saccharothrix algeriensis]|uniref:Uncharacterized protein n=1 Tax=Catellatospora bangladeshensis TaxID=310355 RepID=A0A8J3JLG7_9ACTN|nr:hypothetical protein Cba03nite_60230 [Catellatospora bangladeshensis]
MPNDAAVFAMFTPHVPEPQSFCVDMSRYGTAGRCGAGTGEEDPVEWPVGIVLFSRRPAAAPVVVSVRR